MKVQCPLCKSYQQELKETLRVSDIIRLYKKMFGEDFSYLFSTNFVEYYECLDCALLHFSPMVVADEKMYNRLQKFDWYYSDFKEEYKIAGDFLSDIQTNMSVLEVGAGKGVFKSYLKESDSYVGLEFSQEAIRLANEKSIMLHPERVEEHARKYPNNYDMVCSFRC